MAFVEFTLRKVGFTFAKRERDHCEQPSDFPSSMGEFVTPNVIHLMSISFVNKFFAGSVRTKECEFLAKSADKRTKPSSNYCLYLVCGLNIKPRLRFSCPPRVELLCSLNTTLQTSVRNNKKQEDMIDHRRYAHNLRSCEFKV